MQPLLFAVPLPRELTAGEGGALCLAADETKRRHYLRHPELPAAQQSLVSQALLRYAAARVLDVPMRQVTVGYTDRGPPFLENTRLFCSVSHTDGLCVCALAEQPVGVDAERVRPHVPRVAKRVFSEREQMLLQHSAQPDRFFFETWTRRESYVKCIGTGLADIAAALPENAHFQTLTWQEKFVITVCTFTKTS